MHTRNLLTFCLRDGRSEPLCCRAHSDNYARRIGDWISNFSSFWVFFSLCFSALLLFWTVFILRSRMQAKRTNCLNMTFVRVHAHFRPMNNRNQTTFGQSKLHAPVMISKCEHLLFSFCLSRIFFSISVGRFYFIYSFCESLDSLLFIMTRMWCESGRR